MQKYFIKIEWKKITLIFTAALTNTFYFSFYISASCHQVGIWIVCLQFLPGQSPFIKGLTVEYYRCYNKVQLPKFPWGWGRMRGRFGIPAVPEEWSWPSSRCICVQGDQRDLQDVTGAGFLPQGELTWAHRSCRAEVGGKTWDAMWISGHHCLRKSRKISVKCEIKSLFHVYQVRHFWE